MRNKITIQKMKDNHNNHTNQSSDNKRRNDASLLPFVLSWLCTFHFQFSIVETHN
jgi:hypothetical protein